jgi:DNA invertase Pin-like site-specific DNA recombinase
MALIGYARVSTEDQATRRQLDELRAAGDHSASVLADAFRECT